MESTTYLLIDENGKEHGIITGDTLFIGDVGRPDLAQHVVADLTQDKLARHLFHSLREKIMPLSDDLIVYPNHGAGSACGKMMSKETTDTLGNQKKTNYALRADMTREEFTSEVLDGLGVPPAYFPQNVMMNIQGYASLDSVMDKSKKPLNPTEFKAIANDMNAIILDVRHENDFVKCHIPRSIFIGIQGNFAPWVGSVLKDINTKILLVCDHGQEQEAILRLSRVGFDNCIGYLNGGFKTWKDSGNSIGTIDSISASGLEEVIDQDGEIIDVRQLGERNNGRLKKSAHIPLGLIDIKNDHLNKLNRYYIHCAGGYRSMIACSVLKKQGFKNLIDVDGGFESITSNTSLKIISS